MTITLEKFQKEEYTQLIRADKPSAKRIIAHFFAQNYWFYHCRRPDKSGAGRDVVLVFSQLIPLENEIRKKLPNLNVGPFEG